jgi:hypothetical protein
MFYAYIGIPDFTIHSVRGEGGSRNSPHFLRIYEGRGVEALEKEYPFGSGHKKDGAG